MVYEGLLDVRMMNGIADARHSVALRVGPPDGIPLRESGLLKRVSQTEVMRRMLC